MLGDGPKDYLTLVFVSAVTCSSFKTATDGSTLVCTQQQLSDFRSEFKKKMNRNPVPVLKKEPERRSGAFRSNSNPAYFINWPITVRSVVPFRSVPEIITAQSRVIIAAAARTAVTI